MKEIPFWDNALSTFDSECFLIVIRIENFWQSLLNTNECTFAVFEQVKHMKIY